jgi:hypothetical protein
VLTLVEVARWVTAHFYRKVNFFRFNQNGSVEIGSIANHVLVGANGTVTLVGTATAWDDDLRVPLSSITRGAANAPDLAKFLDNGAGSDGVFAFLFDAGTEEKAFFACQLPHNWKEGTDLKYHVHWAPTTTGGGNVVWGLEYTWSNIDGTFAATTLTTVTDAAGTTAYKHLMTDAQTIAGSGKTHSSMIMARVYRKAADAADTYGADAALLEVDFHYEIDGFGEASL